MKKRISAWLLVIVAAFMTLALSSCKSTEDKLLGTWVETGAVVSSSMTFEANGVGYTQMAGLGFDARFNWTLDDENKTITVSYTSFDSTTFRIVELTDNSLTLSVKGKVLTYIKDKK